MNQPSTTSIPDETRPPDVASPFHSLTIADIGIAALIGLLCFAALLYDLDGPGVTWDEGDVQFPVAKKQAEWFSNLGALPDPFSKTTIDEYWETRSDHPSLPRTVSAFSYLLLHEWIDEIAALRLPAALQFSILLSSIYCFARLFLPRMASFVGAVSLALMPRLFGHAHIFSLDVPIMCWWVWASMAGYLVLYGRLRPVWFGLAFAIAFATKLHALFLPIPLLCWIGWMILLGHRSRVYWKRILWAVAWTLILTPVVYIGSQPWLWHDPFHRIYQRFFDLATKTPISVLYLGTIYRDSLPRHYPLVMTAYTVPLTVIFFFVIGVLSPLQWFGKKPVKDRDRQKTILGVYVFMLLLLAAPLAIFMIPLAKAYDGCRLFLPAFPFIACFAGFGYDWFITKLQVKRARWAAHMILVVLLLAPQIFTIIKIRPYYLAYYNELAGGIQGAWKQGMETTYWCDALTREFLDVINATVPEGRTIKPASMSFGVVQYYIDRGWLRPNIDHFAGYIVLQSRQGMFSGEEQHLYYRKKPLAVVELDGVQLIGLYRRE